MKKTRTISHFLTAALALLAFSTNAQTFNGCPNYSMEDIRQWNKEGVVPVESLIKLPLSILDVIKHEQKCRSKYMEQQKEKLARGLKDAERRTR